MFRSTNYYVEYVPVPVNGFEDIDEEEIFEDCVTGDVDFSDYMWMGEEELNVFDKQASLVLLFIGILSYVSIARQSIHVHGCIGGGAVMGK